MLEGVLRRVLNGYNRGVARRSPYGDKVFFDTAEFGWVPQVETEWRTIRAELARHPDATQLNIRIVDAPDIVGMGEAPTVALRRKPRASIRLAANSVANGDAAALVSAGHTGATVLSAHAAFGMLPGVDRPALAATIPSGDGLGILLDVGANVGCRATHLLQLAAMGAVYFMTAMSLSVPR